MIKKIIGFAAVFWVIGGSYDLARAPSSPGPTTPTSLVITLNSIEIAQDARRAYSPLLNTPTTIDVVKKTGTSDNVAGIATISNGKWGALRFTLSSTGSYTGIDPCTGTDAPGAAIQLPDSNTNTTTVINYMVPHPVTGLKAGYLEMKPLTVASNSLELRLVFQATNSVVCRSSAPPLRTINGSELKLPDGIAFNPINHEIVVSNYMINTVNTYDSSGNNPALYSISGSSTGLNQPLGVYVDTVNSELGVANSGNNTLTFYSQTSDGNVVPIRTLSGNATQLLGPAGVGFDGTTNEIVVTNVSNNSVTSFNRQTMINNTDPLTLTANIPPLRTLMGSNTGLNAPCGLYVDEGNDEIGIVNNQGNSVTVFDRTADGNVTPKRIISGPHTLLSNPCGIYVDTVNTEIGVANAGGESILIYDRTATGDVAPKRIIQGTSTGLNGPAGIYVDTANNEIGVANAGGNSLAVFNRYYPTVQLNVNPDLRIFGLQQELHPQYTSSGIIDHTSGQGDKASVVFEGYQFVWEITDSRIRQPGDATNALLIPPSNEVFGLTDGSQVSSLGLGCNSLVPFTNILLTTNCSGPLISSPYPTGGGTYTIIATLFGEPTINHLAIASIPIEPSQVPWPVPNLHLFTNGNINTIDWNYVDAAGNTVVSPIIVSQKIQINLNQPYRSVSSCYKQVAGNALTLVFDSGTLAPDVRSLPAVKNNGCDIPLSAVDNVIFFYADGVNDSFAVRWNPL